MDFFETNNRPAKLNQEHAVQSCTNNVVKNNWLNAVKRGKIEYFKRHVCQYRETIKFHCYVSNKDIPVLPHIKHLLT